MYAAYHKNLRLYIKALLLDSEQKLFLKCSYLIKNVNNLCIATLYLSGSIVGIISLYILGWFTHLAAGVRQSKDICLAKVSMWRENYNVEHVRKPAKEQF